MPSDSNNKPVVPTSRLSRSLALGKMVARAGLEVAKSGGKAAIKGLDDATGFTELAHLKAAESMVETLGTLKGAALKLGQMMSYVDEALPAPYRTLLARLQSDAPTMDADTVAQVLTEQLGQPLERLFQHFDPTPLAAASIGQVHAATTLDGHRVVVKIQYPGVADAIRADIRNAGFLYTFAQLAVGNVNAQDLREELLDVLLRECDYRLEAGHQQEFHRIWDGDPTLYVPRVYPQLCSEKVLTSERIDGIRFQTFLETASQEARNQAGHDMLRFTWHSLLYHGVFNGDPHPGNYLFMPDGRVAFLDYGCVKHFDANTTRLVKQQINAIHHHDVPLLLDAKRQMGSLHPHSKVPGIDIMALYRYIHRPWLEDRLFEYTPEYTRESYAMLVTNPAARAIRVPREFIFVNRWQWGLNAVLAALRSKARFFSIIEPFLERPQPAR